MQFVIFEDNVDFLIFVEDIIHKTLFKTGINYNINKFTDYDDNLKEIIASEGEKIYLIDLSTGNDLSILKQIREKDYLSIIITMIQHSEIIWDVISENLSVLKFIFKLKYRLEEELVTSIEYAIKAYESKQAIILYKYNNKYRIELKNIIYIYKNKNNKYIKIVTKEYTFKFRKSLKEIKNELNSDFTMYGRSNILNNMHIVSLSKSKKMVKMDNGDIIYY